MKPHKRILLDYSWFALGGHGPGLVVTTTGVAARFRPADPSRGTQSPVDMHQMQLRWRLSLCCFRGRGRNAHAMRFAWPIMKLHGIRGSVREAITACPSTPETAHPERIRRRKKVLPKLMPVAPYETPGGCEANRAGSRHNSNSQSRLTDEDELADRTKI